MDWQKEVPHLAKMARSRAGRPRARTVLRSRCSPAKTTTKRILHSLLFLAFFREGAAPGSHSEGVGNNRRFRFSLRRASSSLPSPFLLFPPARWLSLPPPRLSCSTAGTYLAIR
jgi:hypothetical protein